MKDFNYILASGSPRRIEMMLSHGVDPVVMPAEIEENLPQSGGMRETVMFLALKKAKAVEAALRFRADENQRVGDPAKSDVIIAADTVVFKGEIMGKPTDKQDGFRMLSALRGTVHCVATGVALVEAGKSNARVFAEVTHVYFKDYSDEELLSYLDTNEAYDKAGGYAIQGSFARYVDRIEGDYNNVVGFPWDRIEKELELL